MALDFASLVSPPAGGASPYGAGTPAPSSSRYSSSQQTMGPVNTRNSAKSGSNVINVTAGAGMAWGPIVLLVVLAVLAGLAVWLVA
jgi:hypothetical protein